MKQNFWFIINHASVNVDSMKVYVVPSKTGIRINVGVSVKDYMIEVLLKIIICGILVRVIISVKRHVKLINI